MKIYNQAISKVQGYFIANSSALCALSTATKMPQDLDDGIANLTKSNGDSTRRVGIARHLNHDQLGSLDVKVVNLIQSVILRLMANVLRAL